ncbi:MAG: glycosyltransferase family 2 protein [Burkholderiaceae bacterium]|nr:glycosyltransferase family 2 protein [Burkholderiaceae bacterium]
MTHPAAIAAAPVGPIDAALLDQVTVLTVTYNSAHCIAPLAECLAHLPHVSVVDNASADDTLAQVARQLPRARVIALPRNMGYGVANNQGIEAATTRYVLLLNPDCEISADAIAQLVAGAQHWPDAAVIVPQLTDAAGREEVNYSWPRDDWAPRTGAAEGPLSVGYACAAVMLLDREKMAGMGFFDPRFFLYYEDEDLCLRAFNARLNVRVLPHIRVKHFSRGSVRGPRPLAAEYWRGWHHAQSKIIFALKHQGDAAGARLLRRTITRAWFNVAARVLLVSPRLLARAWGRLQGLRALSHGSPSASKT